MDNSKTDELWETGYRMIKNLLRYKECISMKWLINKLNNPIKTCVSDCHAQWIQ